MTINQSPEGACVGKHPYPNGASAWSVARRVKAGHAHAYRCTFCRQWHIGGSSRRIRRENPVTHDTPRRASKAGSRRKQIAKATAVAVKAHAKCNSDAEKAAVLDRFIARLQEIARHDTPDS